MSQTFVDAEGNHYYSNYQGDKFYTDDPLPEPLTNEQKTYLVETYGVTIDETIPYDEVEPDTPIQSFEQIVEGLEYVENFDSEVQVNVQPSDTSATTNEDGVTPYASGEVSIYASIPDEYLLQSCNLYLYSNVKFNSSNTGITSLNSDGWDLTKNSQYTTLNKDGANTRYSTANNGTIDVTGSTDF